MWSSEKSAIKDRLTRYVHARIFDECVRFGRSSCYAHVQARRFHPLEHRQTKTVWAVRNFQGSRVTNSVAAALLTPLSPMQCLMLLDLCQPRPNKCIHGLLMGPQWAHVMKNPDRAESFCVIVQNKHVRCSRDSPRC